jgi:hypothetical protein
MPHVTRTSPHHPQNTPIKCARAPAAVIDEVQPLEQPLLEGPPAIPCSHDEITCSTSHAVPYFQTPPSGAHLQQLLVADEMQPLDQPLPKGC